MIKILTHYKMVAAGKSDEDKDVTPAVGKSFALKGISYFCPENGISRCIVYWDGTALNDVQDAAYNSKFVSAEGLVFTGDGAKTFKLRLDNGDTVAHAMGVTVYYEENG